MLEEKILEVALRNPEGFSIWIPDLEPVVSGIAVAYKETQNSHGRSGLRKCLRHAITHGKVIGGWLNEENGRFYFDSVKIFEDLRKAKAFGKRNGQIAIYDIDNHRLIKI